MIFFLKHMYLGGIRQKLGLCCYIFARIFSNISLGLLLFHTKIQQHCLISGCPHFSVLKVITNLSAFQLEPLNMFLSIICVMLVSILVNECDNIPVNIHFAIRLNVCQHHQHTNSWTITLIRIKLKKYIHVSKENKKLLMSQRHFVLVIP